MWNSEATIFYYFTSQLNLFLRTVYAKIFWIKICSHIWLIVSKPPLTTKYFPQDNLPSISFRSLTFIVDCRSLGGVVCRHAVGRVEYRQSVPCTTFYCFGRNVPFRLWHLPSKHDTFCSHVLDRRTRCMDQIFGHLGLARSLGGWGFAQNSGYLKKIHFLTLSFYHAYRLVLLSQWP